MKYIVAPFVKLDYVRASSAPFGKPTVTSVVNAACEALKRQLPRSSFSPKNPVVFMDRFAGVESEGNFLKIRDALTSQGCEIVPCPVFPRGANEGVATVDVVLTAETLARVIEHLQNPQQAEVIPLLLLGENKWTHLVRVLAQFDGVEPWVVASASSIGSDLREAAQEHVMLFESILTRETQTDPVSPRPRVSFRRAT